MKWILRVPFVAVVVGLVAVSAATATSASAPSNASRPTISGDMHVGSTLTAGPGNWRGSVPMSFSYQWLICGGNGGACRDIAGQTRQDYVLRAEDPGNTVRVRVTAKNSDGSRNATSTATAPVVSPNAPRNVSAPTISGDVSAGSTLTVNPGGWSGAQPISFRYQWRLCDGNGGSCNDIGGATATTYAVRSGDVGHTIRARVTATNSAGSDSISAVTAKIGSTPAPSPTGCPKLAAGATAVAVTSVASPARLQVDQFLPSGAITQNMTSFSVRFHVSDTCGQPVSGAAVYATAVPFHQVSIPAETGTDSTGWVTLTFSRQSGFPATPRQQLMVMFVRARVPGASPLNGISTNRLISLKVNLH